MLKDIIRRNTVADDHLPQYLPGMIRQIYARRGIDQAEQLDLSTRQLSAVSKLKGTDRACEILHQAFIKQEKIVIVGDFDADGATSTALMMEALPLLGCVNYNFLVPNRFEYGYGLTPQIVEVGAKQGAQLIITVDNGISCVPGVERAKELGMTVIITDHHLPGLQLPVADAIVNPNQPGCDFPSKALAGVGVAFYLMLALRKYLRELNWFAPGQLAEPNLAQLLDLVALGTVADVVALDNNNRILVAQGLKRIRAGQTRPGIQALIEIANKDQKRLVASDFGFALGPRINAAGRLDDMSFGIHCLLAKDLSTAREMALTLDDLNKTRREIEQGMQIEAENVLKQLNLDAESLPNAIALYQSDWHQGVIGIVAGRLKEKFHRPSIVFAAANDDAAVESKEDSGNQEIKGSARSIPGLHIRDLLEHIDGQHPGMIIKFGGHAMAAGLSIRKRSFDQFQQLFNEFAGLWLDKDDLQGTLISDGELSAAQLNLPFAEQIREAGPWGQNFPEPLFDDEFTLIQQRIVGQKHLKLVVQKDNEVFDAIAFNIDTKIWPNVTAKQVHLAYRLDINEFRGKRSLQLMVEQVTQVIN
jgi:single-stranded-DNA-specific exonuclease